MQFGMAKGQSRGDVFAMSPTYRRSKSIKSLPKFMDHNPHHPPKTPVTAVPTSAPPLRTQYSEIPESETEAKQVRKNKRKLSSEPLAELRTMIEEDDEGIQYSLEDGRETKLEFQKLYIIEMGVALIAVIGGFMTVLNYDLEYDERDQELSLIMLWVITVTSVITVFLNVVRYLQKLKYMKARNVISRKATLYSTGDLWIVLLESVFIMLQPYPGLQGIKLEEFSEASNINYYYHVNDIFSLLIICRIFLVLRFVLNSLSYRTPRSHRITSMYGADSDYLYACRCIMKMMPIQGVLVILLCSIVGFGYLIRICESPLSRDIDGTGDMSFSTYWNSMWCVILTMTTVGYGDVYARTMLGRAVSFLMCIWGIFLVSLMVVTLTNILTMSAPEEKSLMILRRLELRKNLKKDAAYILTNIARIGLTRKKNISAEKKNTATKEIVKDIKHHLNSFKLVSREVKGLDDSVGPMEEVNRQIRCLREDVKTIMEAQEKLQKTVHQFVSAPKNPNKFDSRGFADSKLNLRDFEEDVVIRGTR